MPLALKTRMEQAGYQAQLVPFSKMNKEDAIDALCVCLAEYDQPVLSDCSPGNFAVLQSVAEASVGLIWVTCGAASASTEHPELALFQGLARTLRAETEGFFCINVDLDDKERLSADEVARLLCSVHNELFSAGNLSPMVYHSQI